MYFATSSSGAGAGGGAATSAVWTSSSCRLCFLTTATSERGTPRIFQTDTLPFFPVAASQPASGLKATAMTAPFCAKVAISDLRPTSHRRTDPSGPPEAAKRPPASTATAEMSSTLPVKEASSSPPPLRTLTMRVYFGAPDAERRLLSSRFTSVRPTAKKSAPGEKATAVTSPYSLWLSLRLRFSLRLADVPRADRLVLAGREQGLAVGRKRQREDLPFMAGQAAHALAELDVPELDGPVVVPVGEHLRAGTERERGGLRGARDRVRRRAGRERPERDRLLVARGQEASVRRDRGRAVAAAALDRDERGAVGRVPHGDAVAERHEPARRREGEPLDAAARLQHLKRVPR